MNHKSRKKLSAHGLLSNLIDQTQERCDALFQAVLKKRKKKKYLWEKVRNVFIHFLIKSWEDLWKVIASGKMPMVWIDSG